MDKGVLWAGSDDGLVHVTRDGGKTWTNVTPKGLPEWTRISQIDASPHDAGTACLAVNRYKLDDYRPYAFVTTDYGQSWRSVAAGLPADSFVRVVREDPVRPGSLFAGTETGVYVSFDDGASWQPLQRNLPVVPITDLIVKDDDLVVATQGRSFWILDDIGALRQAQARGREHGGAPLRAGAGLPLRRRRGPRAGRQEPALRCADLLPAQGSAEAGRGGDARDPRLEGRAGSRVLVQGGEEGRRRDEDGDDDERPGAAAAKPLPAKAGLNRFAWDLRYPEASKFKGLILWAGQTAGPRVVPGRYQVRLTAAGQTQTQPFEVRKDPRLATSDADLAKQQDLLLKIRDELTATHDAIGRLRDVRDQAKTVAERAKGSPAEKAVAEAADAARRRS